MVHNRASLACACPHWNRNNRCGGSHGFAVAGRDRGARRAIQIDGEPYWCGGYSGNPNITPLIRECKSQDTILVQINPVEREKCPRSASEIRNRLNEVSFNAV